MSSIDPQITASIVSGISGIIAGAFGGNFVGKKQAMNTTSERCDKICSLMVNSFDKLLTALEVAGEPPTIKIAVRDARDSIITAKNYLGLSGTELKLESPHA